MKERPILFSGPMVRAILYGRKTQTRRLVRPQPDPCAYSPGKHALSGQVIEGNDSVLAQCPYGRPGDLLWVREAWGLVRPLDPTDWCTGSIRGRTADELLEEWVVAYRADSATRPDGAYWRPPMFMPRWASRLTLEITGIRVERVRDISEKDALAEGVTCVPFRPDEGFPICEGFMVGKDDGKTPLHTSAKAAFLDLFFNINQRAPKDSDPWVWAIEFKVVTP